MSNLSQFAAGGDPQYWVSGTTYALGKTVRSPTDHQRYVRVVAGAGTTDPANDATNWRPDGGRAIKSIQRGIAQLPFASVTRYVDVVIATVNPAKSLLTLLSASNRGDGNSYDGGYPQQISLVNNSTIRVDVGASLYNPSTYQYSYSGYPVSWQIVEYY